MLYLYLAILIKDQMEIRKVNAAELFDWSREEAGGFLLHIINGHKQIIFMYNPET
jgi:hypothetical protein